jgi:DNA-binding transcriptional MerR regulator
MRSAGLKDAIRRTGLSRRQLRYLEERSLLGFVARSDGRTVYTLEQLDRLEHIARLRALGSRIDEAAQIARELQGEPSAVSQVRLDELEQLALAIVERSSRVAQDLLTLRARRLGRAG